MSDAVILSPVIRWWRCPSCDHTDRTVKPGANEIAMHQCPALNGINIPLVEVSDWDVKPDAVHEEHEREDYTRNPDDGRVASIHTRHGDGREDATVLAPTARIQFQF